MTQLRRQDQRLGELGIDVAVVTFDADFLARMYVEQTSLRWPLLLDPDRTLYRAYDMDRATLWSIYGPASIWTYMKLVFRGRLIRRPGRDTRQVGGDVMIDPTGIVNFHFVSTSPHDRPSVAQLLAAVETRAGGRG